MTFFVSISSIFSSEICSKLLPELIASMMTSLWMFAVLMKKISANRLRWRLDFDLMIPLLRLRFVSIGLAVAFSFWFESFMALVVELFDCHLQADIMSNCPHVWNGVFNARNFHRVIPSCFRCHTFVDEIVPIKPLQSFHCNHAPK